MASQVEAAAVARTDEAELVLGHVESATEVRAAAGKGNYAVLLGNEQNVVDGRRDGDGCIEGRSFRSRSRTGCARTEQADHRRSRDGNRARSFVQQSSSRERHGQDCTPAGVSNPRASWAEQVRP